MNQVGLETQRVGAADAFGIGVSCVSWGSGLIIVWISVCKEKELTKLRERRKEYGKMAEKKMNKQMT